MVHSVNDVNLDTVTGEIPGVYQGTIIKLYLKDLKHPAEDIEGIYWSIIGTDKSNVQDGSPTYKIIYVTALMK